MYYCLLCVHLYKKKCKWCTVNSKHIWFSCIWLFDNVLLQMFHPVQTITEQVSVSIQKVLRRLGTNYHSQYLYCVNSNINVNLNNNSWIVLL